MSAGYDVPSIVAGREVPKGPDDAEGAGAEGPAAVVTALFRGLAKGKLLANLEDAVGKLPLVDAPDLLAAVCASGSA